MLSLKYFATVMNSPEYCAALYIILVIYFYGGVPIFFAIIVAIA